MYEDVPNSIMLDNTILNELENENVIPFQSSYIEKFKTPVNRGFFFI